VLVKRINDIDPYLPPESPVWRALSAKTIPMSPTPVALQPTQYIRVKWETRPYGQVPAVEIRAAHDGKAIAFAAEWDCDNPHPDDALAIALPIRGQPALMLMGSADSPIHFLHWKAKQPGVRSTYSTGIGTTQQGMDVTARAQETWSEKKRRVVITRQMGEFDEAAPLLAGERTKIGFAVWLGANNERAGLKAFSMDWEPLEVEG
jgi:DMSO reductase family type II enzyme heme b subunit